MKKLITKSLVGLVMIGAFGCSAELSCSQSKRKSRTYEMDFDQIPQVLALQLYARENNGAYPSDRNQLVPYGFSPIDLNDNGVLDYHMEFTVVKEEREVVEFTERIVYRAAANGTDKDEVKVNRFVFNGNGNYTLHSSEDFVAPEEEMNRVVSEHETGENKRNMDKMRRLLNQELRNPSSP